MATTYPNAILFALAVAASAAALPACSSKIDTKSASTPRTTPVTPKTPTVPVATPPDTTVLPDSQTTVLGPPAPPAEISQSVIGGAKIASIMAELGTFKRRALVSLTDEPAPPDGIDGVHGATVLASATLVVTDEAGVAMAPADVTKDFFVSFIDIDPSIDRTLFSVVVITGKGTPDEQRTVLRGSLLTFEVQPDGRLRVTFATNLPNATFVLVRNGTETTVAGVTSLRRFFQTRNVMRLTLAPDFATSGDEISLENLTTQALLFGPTGYDGSASLDLYRAPGLAYGANDLRLRGDGTGGVKVATLQVTLHDFSIFGSQLASFDDGGPDQAAFAGWASPLAPSVVQGTTSGRTLSTQFLRVIHE